MGNAECGVWIDSEQKLIALMICRSAFFTLRSSFEYGADGETRGRAEAEHLSRLKRVEARPADVSRP